ncbi:helix-turn-helix transcriptional regulator [Pseudoflavonifractor phocaeensis]|uniref:helix-turn-helix transcriptional regulator n=1 Tax=Pseudoflavonifractor phocaeensis TaxID=1870988 RepID=UPI00210C5B44|nr:helix-turn-helix domain-containing protein [Pseudoflavonifractor phocaeensis]MCQ4864498.1 helix-turn-helix domain-containing protein [Pseudoflavonifractor phocaeensis]
MTLGQRIQELRKALGLSQEGLGEKLKVSRQAISKWEADGAVPEVDKLIALSRLFGISLNELLQVDCPASTPEEEAAAAEFARRARRRRLLKNVSHALTLMAVVVGAAVLSAVLARQSAQLDTARDALAAQESRISQLETQVSALAEAAARPGLDSSAPLVGDFSIRYFSTEKAGMRVHVSLLPAQSTEMTTVTFQISRPGINAVVQEAERLPGTTEYQAELLIPSGGDGVTISAIFDDGTAQHTQPLLSNLSVRENSVTYTPLWLE